MKLPVTTPALDAATLWRRYTGLLTERLTEVGETIDAAQGTGIALPHADWLIDAGDTAGRPGRTVVRLTAGNPASSHVLVRLRQATLADAATLFVLPGRAARAAYERLCVSIASETADATGLDVAAHLDDPQFEPLVVVEAGEAVACAGLQTRGQTGALFDWYVRPSHRRRGLGRALVGRGLELASRAQLLDVFAGVPAESAAERLLRDIGFDTVLRYDVRVTSPSTDAS